MALAGANIIQDVAKETLAKVSEEDKGSKYYRAKVMIFHNQNKVEQGIRILEEGIESLRFTTAELFDLLGDLYFETNNIDKAIEAWKNAEKQDSRNKVLAKKILEKKYYAPEYN